MTPGYVYGASRPTTRPSVALLDRPPVRSIASAPDHLDLTHQQLVVLALAAEGKTDHEIAKALFLSRKTVAAHVSQAISKLDAQDRAHAVAMALRAGAIRPDLSHALHASAAEVCVLTEVASGATNAEVGERLGVQPRTVRTHLERISRRWGVNHRAHLVALAIHHGLIP